MPDARQTRLHNAMQASLPTIDPRHVAVIGMSCRFPGATCPESFWTALKHGRDCVSDIPDNRWPLRGFYDPDPKARGRSICKTGGFLENPWDFDPLFFNISPREAEFMDPQQRLFLMEAWQALERAGYGSATLSGTSVGVFVGCAEGDYADRFKTLGLSDEPYFFMGNSTAILSARISYFLNLKGPALSIDTACSSSLTALHLACESVRRGECEMAVSGGVNVMTTPRLYLMMSRAGMLSTGGRIRAFDAGADGFIPAEGAGAVVLKSLKNALRDGDPILGVIEASGTNQDGRTSGITAPNGPSQTTLIRHVHESFNIDPRSISYLEAHGTGTRLGDPIEFTAASEAFGATDSPFCRIGSVKSNIGHSLAASGIASLCKTLLCLQHGQIPPSLHYEAINPHIDLSQSPFLVAETLLDWEPETEQRRAAISSFGFSGTNVHVVVAEPPTNTKADGTDIPANLILLSAGSARQLAQRANDLILWVKDHDLPVTEVSRTLMGQTHHRYRHAFTARDRDELLDGLKDLSSAHSPGSKTPSDAREKRRQTDAAHKLLQAFPERSDSIQPSFFKALDWLAVSYVSGAEVDETWQRLFMNATPKRATIIPAPLKLEQYVIEAPKLFPAKSEKQFREFPISEDATIVRDHVIGGQSILPGSFSLAQAVNTALELTGGPAIRIEDICWITPLAPTGQDSLILECTPVDGAWHFTGHGAVTKTPHIDGRFKKWEGNPASPKQPDTTEKALTFSADTCYQSLADAGAVYGPTFRGLLSLDKYKNHIIADVSLPDTADRSPIPPELLDATWQAAAFINADASGKLNGIHAPGSCGSFTLYTNIPNAVRVTASRSTTSRPNAGLVANISIADQSGNVVATVEDLTFVSLSTAKKGDGEKSILLFSPTWEQAPLDNQHPPTTDHPLVIGFDETLVHAVAEATDGTAIAHDANIADALDRHTNAKAVIIIMNATDRNEEHADKALHSFAPLLSVLQAMSMAQLDKILLLYPTDAPGRSYIRGLPGLSLCARHEFPGISVAHVEVNISLWNENTLSTIAKEELGAMHDGVEEIRRRPDDRLKTRLAERPMPDLNGGLPVREGGTYLVTGGSGALGRIVTRYLLTKAACNVIMLGRSPLEDPTLTAFDDVKQPGARCIYAVGDVSIQESLNALLKHTRKEFGPLTGIIHAAGSTNDALIEDITPEDTLSTMKSKTVGPWLLHELTRDDPLEFFVLYSALAGRAGNPGQGAYAFANRSMDAFADWREDEHRDGTCNGRTLAVDWPLWEVGMEMAPIVKQHLDRRYGLVAMPREEGLLALDAAWALDRTNVVVAYGNGDKLRRTLTDIPHESAVLAPTQDSAQRHDELLGQIIDIACAQLKLRPEDIDPDEELSSYGFDSISLTVLAQEINERFGVTMTTARFFELRDLDELAAYIADNWPEVYAVKTGTTSIKPATAPSTAQAGAPEQAHSEPIAVIGMDCRFPGAADPDSFWEILEHGRNCMQEIPKSRWNWRLSAQGLGDQGEAMRWGAFLTGTKRFDHAHFGISPAEALHMDPQQRLLLETAWRTLEHAGYDPETLKGSETGVFIGASNFEYREILEAANLEPEAFTPSGLGPSMLSNRLSYYFDFHGPSETLDTACSSSLIALDHAIGNLRQGRIRSALVGGVNLMLTPGLYRSFAKAGAISLRGRCKSFDAAADGYARGEGVATILLKPLSAAIQDKDTVHGLILSSSVNHGGRATSLTAPNARLQGNAMATAWRDAGLTPNDIDYIEAHGTGTELGDPVEINGLVHAVNAFDESTTSPIKVGTVKSNIGHLEAAAGMAGIIKTLLSFSHGLIPSNPQLETVNPQIEIDGTPIELVRDAIPWPKTGPPRIAGVSSFGFGGANAHVVLEENRNPSTIDHAGPWPILLSADNDMELRSHVQRLLEHLGNQTPTVPAASGNNPNSIISILTGLLNVPDNSISTDDTLEDLGMTRHSIKEFKARLERLFGKCISLNALPVTATLGDIVEEVAGSSTSQTTTQKGNAPRLVDIAYTLVNGRPHKSVRHAFLVQGMAELHDGLAKFLDNREPVLLKSSGEQVSLIKQWVAGDTIDQSALRWPEDAHRIPLPVTEFHGPIIWPEVVQPKTHSVPAEPKSHFFTTRWVNTPPTTAAGTVDIITFIGSRTDTEQPAAVAKAMGISTELKTMDALPESISGPVIMIATQQLDIIENASHLCRDIRSILKRMEPNPRLVVVWNGDRSSQEAIPFTGLSGMFASLRKELGGAHLFTANYPAEVGFTPFLPALLADLSHDHDDCAVRYSLATEGVKRQAWRMESNTASLDTSRDFPLPDNPICLITGGTGVLGRRLARHLSSIPGARLALTGRDETNEKITAIMEELKSVGTEAIYLPADISNGDETKALIDDITNNLGHIDAIFHVAGIIDQGLFLHGDNDADVIGPKVSGAINLDAATASDVPALFVLFSSAASWLGNPGQAVYSYANRCLDGFAEARSARMDNDARDSRTLSICWPLWESGSQRIAAGELQRLGRETGLELLPDSVGMDWLHRAVTQESPVAMVLYGPPNAPALKEILRTAPLVRTNRGQPGTTDLLAIVIKAVSEALSLPADPSPEETLTDLGLNSLTALRLSNAITEQTGKQCRLNDLMALKQVRDIAEFLELTEITTATATTRTTDKSGAYPLSPSQSVIWNQQRLSPGNPAYNMPLALRIPENVTTDMVREAVSELSDRHNMLRLRITEKNGQPIQTIAPRSLVDIPVQTVPADMLIEQLREATARPMNLAGEGPLAGTIYTTDSESVLLLVFHHIAVDGISVRVLFDELNTLLQGKNLGDVKDNIFVDFIGWSEEYFESPDGKAALDYWVDKLADPVVPLRLPSSKRPRTPRRYIGHSIDIEVDKDIIDGLRRLCADRGTTLFAGALACAHAVLADHVQNRQVRTASPFANRIGTDLDRAVGPFMHLLVFGSTPDKQQRGIDLIDTIASDISNGMEHAQMPLPRIKQAMRATGNLFQAAFYHQEWLADLSPNNDTDCVPLTEIRHEGEFELAYELISYADSHVLKVKYDRDTLDEATANLLAHRWLHVARQLTDHPKATLSKITGPAPQEIAYFICQNDTRLDLETGMTLPQAIANIQSTETAVLFADKAISHETLGHWIAAVATTLRQRQRGPGQRVGILLDRSEQLPAAMLGVLRSGASYVPLDPAYPEERLAYMLEDSGVSIILTDDKQRTDFIPEGVTVLTMDEALSTDGDTTDMPWPGTDDEAYLIYTSGSTGKPKGVSVSNENLWNFLQAMNRVSDCTPDDTFLAVTTISFDIAVLELFQPLINGATVLIASTEEQRDGIRLLRLMESSAPTICQATPLTWKMLLAAKMENIPLRRILIGGETVPPELADRLHERCPDIINVYGPTETTVWSLAMKLDAGSRVTIGHPIANTLILILDEKGEPCATGVPGELFIGGLGVTLGYHGLPEQNAEQFVTLKTTKKAGIQAGRYYRTGDRVQRLADGNIEYLGRLDQQIKVRGQRVEPSEVEDTIIQRLDAADCACVLRQQNGRPLFTAFMVPGPDSPDESERAERLLGWLPSNIFPDQWITLADLPRTLNGKTDRSTLSKASLENLKTNHGIAEIKRTGGSNNADKGTTRALRQLVAETLGVAAEDVPLHAPFGTIGLDSLSLVDLATAVSRHFGKEVTPTDFFNRPSVQQMVDFLEEAKASPMVAEVRETASPKAATSIAPVRETDIAVVGMAGRFPGADSVEAFWENLLKGRDAIQEIPSERWDWKEFYDPDQRRDGATVSRWGCYLSDVAGFDHERFGIPAWEASHLDPQQRIFLTQSVAAIENAGYSPEALAGGKIGVYAGTAMGDYHKLVEQAAPYNAFSLLGNSPAVLPSRVSHLFDFKGPSESVDTSCSSSLVAVHNACNALANGEADMALAGGSFLMLTPLAHLVSSSMGILSPSGRARPFDEDADGIVIGETVAALVLKPLSRALEDGDTIRAVIKGSFINHDGRTSSFSSPNGMSQAELIREARQRAGVDADSISYVETHGTGTRLGDPVELEGLRLADEGATSPCVIGSVKANIGHAYQAAGIASLIKTVLCLEHGMAPPQIQLYNTNEGLKLDNGRYHIPTSRTQLTPVDGRLIAGVSSFGFTGTNAHVIIEGYTAPDMEAADGNESPIILSAPDDHLLEQAAGELAKHLENTIESDKPLRLEDISFTLRSRETGKSDNARLGFTASTIEEVIRDLCAHIAGQPVTASTPDMKAWLAGETVHWAARETAKRIPLPARPLRESRFWIGDDVEAKADHSTCVTSPAPSAPAPEPAGNNRLTLKAEIAAMVDRNVDDLEDALHLEADLGLDSIRITALAARFATHMDATSTTQPQELASARTVGELLDLACAHPAPAKKEIHPAKAAASPELRDAPMAEAQWLFLLGHHLIDSSGLCSVVRLSGPIDMETARHAWQILVDENPALRIVFQAPVNATILGQTTTKYAPQTDVPPLRQIDLSEENRPDAALHDRFEGELNRRWDLGHWPLHEFSLFKLGKDDYALAFSNEHLVSDGISNQFSLRRFLELYEAIGAGESPSPDTAKGEADYEQFMRRLKHLTDETGEADNDGPAPEPCFWNPDKREITHYSPHFASLTYGLSQKETKRLSDVAARLGVGNNALICAAVLRAYLRHDLPDHLCMQIPTSGRVRRDADASALLGCFALNLSLAVDPAIAKKDRKTLALHLEADILNRLAKEEDWHADIRLARAIRSEIPMDQGIVPKPMRPVIRQRLRSNLYSPYVGDTGIKTQYGPLKITDFFAGTVNAVASVDTLNQIFDGRLVGSLNYDAEFFDADRMAQLRADILDELRGMTRLRPGKAGPQGTPGKPAPDSRLKKAVINAASNVLQIPLGQDDLHRHLEAEFGADSLMRIRMVARLPKSLRQEVRSGKLLAARTLFEMAQALADADTLPRQHDKPEIVPTGPIADLSRFTTPIEAIFAQTKTTPDAIAVSEEDENGTVHSVTYAELVALANRTANALRDRNIAPGEFVGLLLNPGIAMIASIVGVLRVGCAYVPLMPEYPSSRLHHMIAHSGMTGLIIQPETEEQAVSLDLGNTKLEAIFSHGEPSSRQSTTLINKATDVEPDIPMPATTDSMVILYTSGSTGQSKGVVLRHDGYMNRLNWHQRQFALHPGEVVLQKTSCAFDVSVWELIWPIMVGGIIHTVPRSVARDPWALADTIRTHNVAITHFVPSMFAEFIAAQDDNAPFPALRWLIFSGEALAPAHIRTWLDIHGTDTGLANLYGPTEASIDVTCHIVETIPNGISISIGRAIDGVNIHVLDDNLAPVKQGEIGELCIGGIQLADGYLHDPEKTVRTFVTIDTSSGRERIYRTGDLVRQLDTGEIDFLGRKDFQVKIRGNRIELGEIETALLATDGVDHSLVLAIDRQGVLTLEAFVSGTAESSHLRNQLAATLPASMIPASITVLERMPLTDNGKLDRKALTAMAMEKQSSTAPTVRCHPLGPAQRWLLQHFPEPWQWWGYSRFTYHGQLDIALAKKTFTLLSERFSSLRTRTVTAGTSFKQQVMPPGDMPFRLDFADMYEAEPAELESRLDNHAKAFCETLRIDTLPLNGAFIAKTGPDQHEFLIMDHHINSDFITGQILFQTFWETYAALAAGNPPGKHHPPDFSDFVSHLADCEKKRMFDADLAHWNALPRLPRATFSPDNPDAPNREQDARTLEIRFSTSVSRSLMVDAEKYFNASLHTLLTAAVARAINKTEGDSEVVISHRMNGRDLGPGHPSFMESTGNFAVHYPVVIPDASSRTWRTLISMTGDHMASVPTGGVTYDWLSEKLDRAIYPDEKMTAVRLNYLGHIRTGRQGPFEVRSEHYNARLAPQDQIRSATIELHFAVRDKSLEMTLTYPEGQYEAKRMKIFVDQIKKAIQGLGRSAMRS